jgi:leucyl aminopeptidase
MLQGTPLGEQIAALLASKDIGGSCGDLTPILGASGIIAKRVLMFGLGAGPAIAPSELFAAGVAVSRRLSGKPRGHVAVALPGSGEPNAAVRSLTEGLIVGMRGPELRKKEGARHAFESLSIVVPPGTAVDPAVAEAAERAVIVGEAVNLARELVNTPPSEKPPRRLAEIAREVATAAGIRAEVWDLARIKTERFGGLLGVSRGSEEPPAFVVLDYQANPGGPTIALVGKGVTFDSGGLSIKPSASMEDMKSDMTGAAVVLASMQAVARLELPVNLRGYLALTENMTGGSALKLGDVLTMRNGKTVEVMNTDAEGRLILADALSFAVESKPSCLLDLATLTGACMVALGTKIAGLFSNDNAFAEAVQSACRTTGERAWRLPLDDDYKEGLKSNVADFKNVGGKWGGAVTAAKFLEQFVGETRWTHLDIAGPSWVDTEGSTRDAGGTGCFVRTLVALIEAGWTQNVR